MSLRQLRRSATSSWVYSHFIKTSSPNGSVTADQITICCIVANFPSGDCKALSCTNFYEICLTPIKNASPASVLPPVCHIILVPLTAKSTMLYGNT